MRVNLNILKLFVCCSMAMLVIACENGEGGENGGENTGGNTEALYEKEGYNIMGTVTCNGVGVRNVVVSDGTKVTKTDASGRFWIKSDLDFKPEVFISVPSGYETVDRKGTGMAFYAYTEDTDKVQTFHFTLKEVNQSNYELLAMADSHVLGGAKGGKYTQGSTLDTTFYRRTFIPAFRSYIKRATGEGRRVYAVHCGDMTQQTAWGYYGVQEYCDDTSIVEEIHIFNALGNHDHDHCNQANNKQEYTEENQQLSRTSFRKAVGPGYYSFNIGSEHYVVLDNMFIIKHETDYKDKVDPLQIAWLKKDIQAMDKKTVKGLVVVMHSAYRWLDNKADLDEIFKDYPVTYIIGHHHCDRTYISQSSTGKTIKEFWTPSLAGTAWLHTMCGDGTPRSYISYRFKNGVVTDRVFKTFDEEYKNNAKSYRVYDNGSNSAVDYKVHHASGDNTKRADEIAYENANESTLRPAAIINAWGAYTCEYTGSEDVTTSSAVYDLSYRDWYWESHASSDRNSIYASANGGQGPAHQLPSKAIPHIWRFSLNKSSSTTTTLPIVLKDAQGKETRVTLNLK
ncbi:MAG: hypothetical protein IKA49_04590 [Alistipes sp.]|nr:hypothetical protein [Alistipes sp.]